MQSIEIGVLLFNIDAHLCTVGTVYSKPNPGWFQVRLVGNMHGNEVIGREVLLQLARFLVLGYTRDTRIRYSWPGS